MTSNDVGVFASRGFRLYYAGQTLSYLGDGLRVLAIPLLVFHLTGSGTSLGITYALEFLPFAAFSMVGGSLADRLDRRKLMIACDAARFAIVVLITIAYLTRTLSLPMLYACVALLAIGGAAFLGGQASSIPYLLGKDRAKAAVSLLVGTEQGMNLIAPPLGGALFAITGPVAALVINAVTYLTSQLALTAVAGLGPDTPGALPTWRELIADIRAGFRFAMHDRALRVLCWIQLFNNGFALLGFAAIIPYLKREFGASDQTVGIAFGAIAIGSVAGSIAAGRTHLPFGRAYGIALLCDALAWGQCAWLHSLTLAVLAIAASSAFGTYQAATVISWRMRIIPEDMVGRVFGAVRFLVLAGAFPGAILGGIISDRAGARTAALVGALGMLLASFVVIATPAIRRDTR